MSNDRLSGLALIVGSSGMIITMVLHPTGHVAADKLEAMIPMLITVHALALACVPVMFLGTWGLSQRVQSSRAAAAALVVYSFALLAVMNAAVAAGLVTPPLLRQIVAAGASGMGDSWRMLARYNFYVNQAYAQVFVVASSVAIILWSASIWRSKALARGLGVCGCVLGGVVIIGLFTGHLNLDAHGFGIIIFGQAGWFIVAGGLLWNLEGTPTASLP
jgi:hypothetical protein